MTISRLLRFVRFALAVLVVTSISTACKGGGLTGPTPNPPVAGVPSSPIPDPGTVTTTQFRWSVTDATLNGNVVSNLGPDAKFWFRVDLPPQAGGQPVRLMLGGRQVAQGLTGANGSFFTFGRRVDALIAEGFIDSDGHLIMEVLREVQMLARAEALVLP